MASTDQLKTHGITESTPKNLMFSAGTYYKNLKYQTNAWTGTILGATSGGGTLTITPEYLDAELDGATVKVKGAKNMVGMTAQMSINLTEISEGVFVDALHLVKVTGEDSADASFVHYTTKDMIGDDDYLENIAFVGLLNDGRRVICIMDNALCTSALELSPANKTQATYSATFECHASITQDSLMRLPVHIYFPVATV